MSRAFVNEDAGSPGPSRRFVLPPRDDPGFNAAAAEALLEAAREGDTSSRGAGHRLLLGRACASRGRPTNHDPRAAIRRRPARAARATVSPLMARWVIGLVLGVIMFAIGLFVAAQTPLDAR